ncbi:MAG TPA: hypothetical protein VN253_16895 [Kofleriaceae bacterium]|nr:hypothetical protein [Kofleriaceae bacterium]
MTATAAAPLVRLAAIGADLVRKAPALVVALLAFLESIVRALDAAHAERKAPAPAPVIIAHVDTADTAIVSADELLEFLRRSLGWAADRLPDAEHAFRAVCEMAGGRAALLLLGEGSLLGIARRLHELTLPELPFVVLGTDDSATEALDRAAGGMVYVDARNLPRNLVQLAASIRAPEARARLVVSAERAAEIAELVTLLPRTATVRIPPIAERTDELDRLIDAYGDDAMVALDAPELGFRLYDLEWVRASGVSTLEEIEEVARRLVALRNWGVTGGAKRLGINHGALSRWARRRRIPT